MNQCNPTGKIEKLPGRIHLKRTHGKVKVSRNRCAGWIFHRVAEVEQRTVRWSVGKCFNPHFHPAAPALHSWDRQVALRQFMADFHVVPGQKFAVLEKKRLDGKLLFVHLNHAVFVLQGFFPVRRGANNGPICLLVQQVARKISPGMVCRYLAKQGFRFFRKMVILQGNVIHAVAGISAAPSQIEFQVAVFAVFQRQVSPSAFAAEHRVNRFPVVPVIRTEQQVFHGEIYFVPVQNQSADFGRLLKIEQEGLLHRLCLAVPAGFRFTIK